MNNRKETRQNFEAWYAHIEAMRVNIDPLESRLTSFLNNTVSYGQLGLRSAFLLNGGGLSVRPETLRVG